MSLFLSQPTSLWSLFSLSVQPRSTDHKHQVLVPAFPTKVRHRHSTEEAFAQDLLASLQRVKFPEGVDSHKERTFSFHVVTGDSSSRLLAMASSSLDLTPRVSFSLLENGAAKITNTNKAGSSPSPV